jgi:hypothetical protein
VRKQKKKKEKYTNQTNQNEISKSVDGRDRRGGEKNSVK